MTPAGETDALSPYTRLLNQVHDRGWRATLEQDDEVWRLDLYEGDDLVCRVHSSFSVPACFHDLGCRGAVAVARYLRAT